MAEARKVFPMQTFVSYLRGKAGNYNQEVLELLSFVTQKQVDKELAPFASAMSKAWIYEQHPELARLGKEEVRELGENVSILSLPADVQEEVNYLFDKIAEYKQTIEEQKAKIAEYEGILEENKKKIAALEAKVADYEAQMKEEGEKKIIASAAKVDEYIKKVDELLAKIEEVKKHGVVAVSSEGAAAAAEDSGAEATETKTSEAKAEFGFGGDLSDGEFGF
jgi:predicted RNase H-like nuclease (RuvC/YqgF family)